MKKELENKELKDVNGGLNPFGMKSGDVAPIIANRGQSGILNENGVEIEVTIIDILPAGEDNIALFGDSKARYVLQNASKNNNNLYYVAVDDPKFRVIA